MQINRRTQARELMKNKRQSPVISVGFVLKENSVKENHLVIAEPSTWFQNVFHPNVKPAFSNSPGLKSVFLKTSQRNAVESLNALFMRFS